MNILFILIVVCLSLSGMSLTAQPRTQSAPTGAIQGKITDAETGQPLQSVAVRVENRSLGAYTTPQGAFVLRNLPSGTYTLLVSFVGYELRSVPVTVREGDTATANIQLRQQILKTNEIVVSSGKRAQSAQEVPASVSFVDQTAIQQRGITRIDDALRYIPGVNINRDQINIRGSSGFSLGFGSRVMMLMDGFPLLSPDGGDIKFDVLPMFNVERIEVIKGAGSALYGTGALGGVVNVITGAPSETPDVRFRAFSGVYTLPRYDEWRWRTTLPYLGGVDASYSQKFGNFGALITAGFKRNEGHMDYFQNQQWNVFSKLSYEFSQRTSLNLLLTHASDFRTNWVSWKNLRNATRPPDGTNYDELFQSLKSMAAMDFRTVFTEDFFMTARAGIYRTEFTTIGQILTPGQSLISSVAYAYNGEAQFTSILDTNFLVTYGITGTVNLVTSSPIIASNIALPTQTIVAGYAQAEYKPLKKLTFTLGTRVDVEQTSQLPNSGAIVSPRAGATYIVSEETQLRASVGAGFRAPTIAERFAALRFGQFVVAPNTNLRNERSLSAEVGGKQGFQAFGEQWSLDGAIFNNEFWDFVEPVLLSGSGGPQIQFQNVTRARIQGVEVALNGWLPNRVMGFETSFTGMYARDLNLNQPLRYRPTVLWYSRLILPVSAFQFQVDYRFQSRVERIDDLSALVADADARVPIHIVDARVQANLYQLAGIPLLLTLNVRNALDYYYNEIIANLAPTRSIVLQVDMKF